MMPHEGDVFVSDGSSNTYALSPIEHEDGVIVVDRRTAIDLECRLSDPD